MIEEEAQPSTASTPTDQGDLTPSSAEVKNDEQPEPPPPAGAAAVTPGAATEESPPGPSAVADEAGGGNWSLSERVRGMPDSDIRRILTYIEDVIKARGAPRPTRLEVFSDVCCQLFDAPLVTDDERAVLYEWARRMPEPRREALLSGFEGTMRERGQPARERIAVLYQVIEQEAERDPAAA